MTVSETLCSALYLTQPNPLWNNEVSGHTFDNIRPYQTQLVKTELAIHSPHIAHMSEHRLNEVWGKWIPGYRRIMEPYTASQRDMVIPSHISYLQGHNPADKVLDAYLKTVPIPTNDVVGARTSSVGCRDSAIHVRLDTHSRTKSQRTMQKNTTKSTKRHVSPLIVANLARQGRLRSTTFLSNETRRLKRSYTPGPSLHVISVPRPLQVSFQVQPNRFVSMLPIDKRPDIVSVVSHPWTYSAYVFSRLEHLLLYDATKNTKETLNRNDIKSRLRHVRTSMLRIHEISMWHDTCAIGSDMLQPHKLSSLSKGTITPCTTPLQWRNAFIEQYDRLCPSTVEGTTVWQELMDSVESDWWSAQGNHARFVDTTSISSQHKPFYESLCKSSMNEAARRACIVKQYPKLSTAEVDSFVRSSEWFNRFVHASDVAKRKEISIPSWTLTHAVTLQTRTRASTNRSSNRKTVRNSSMHQSASKKKRRSRRRSGSRTSASSSKKYGGGATQHSKSNVRPTSYSLDPLQMDPLHITNEFTIQRPHNTQIEPESTLLTKPSNKLKKEPKKKTERTIVLESSIPKVQKKLRGQKGGAKSGRPVVNITKKDDTSSTNRLTVSEIAAYRKGLNSHVKANGGGPFIKKEQEKQQRSAPAFNFVKLFPKDSPFLKSIPSKLRTSARNRNILRRVKREMLQSYGFHKKSTYKQRSNDMNTSSDPLVQEAGGRKRKSSPRLQDGKHDHVYTGSLYTRKHRANEPDGKHTRGGVDENMRVTWENTLSTGEPIVDTSAQDLDTTKGLSTLNLTDLESVVVG